MMEKLIAKCAKKEWNSTSFHKDICEWHHALLEEESENNTNYFQWLLSGNKV